MYWTGQPLWGCEPKLLGCFFKALSQDSLVAGADGGSVCQSDAEVGWVIVVVVFAILCL